MFGSYVGYGMGSFENYAFGARKEVPCDEGEQSLQRLQIVLGNNVRKIRVESNLSQERFGLMIESTPIPLTSLTPPSWTGTI